jgi:hypothetical protein
MQGPDFWPSPYTYIVTHSRDMFLDIIHRPVFIRNTRRFGDWILSPKLCVLNKNRTTDVYHKISNKHKFEIIYKLNTQNLSVWLVFFVFCYTDLHLKAQFLVWCGLRRERRIHACTVWPPQLCVLKLTTRRLWNNSRKKYIGTFFVENATERDGVRTTLSPTQGSQIDDVSAHGKNSLSKQELCMATDRTTQRHEFESNLLGPAKLSFMQIRNSDDKLWFSI